MSSHLNPIEGATAMRQRPVTHQTPQDALGYDVSDLIYVGCPDPKDRELRINMGRQYLRMVDEDGVVIETLERGK